MLKSRPKYVKEIKDIPTGPHFAVLIGESRTYDDGYGSRDNPSTSTMQYLEYLAFENIEQVAEWVREEDARHTYGAKKDFRVVEIRPCVVHREVRIGVQPYTPDS